MHKLFDRMNLPILIVACLTLGLAPFMPEPHLWEKLKMLTSGELTKPVDIFDLLLHGTPWILLIIKLVLLASKKRKHENPG
jgi:uncharacterized membrane protein